MGIAEFHDAHGIQTRLIGGSQINELSPLPQSLIAGGTGVGDTDKVVVRADALLPCMAADIQHLPGVGPQLRLRGAGEGTFIVESHPPQRTPGVTGKGKHLLCRAEGDGSLLLGEGEQRLQSGQPLAEAGSGVLRHHTGALRTEAYRLPALAPQ